MGYRTEASGDNSTAIGRNITVSGVGTVGIGLDDTPIDVVLDNVVSIRGGNVGVGLYADAKLTVTNDDTGQSSFRVRRYDGIYQNDFVVASDGQVGVGTWAPFAKLAVYADAGEDIVKFYRDGSQAMVLI